MKWKSYLATNLKWNQEISNKAQKEEVALQLAKRLKKGDVVGVGSGSTSFLTLIALAKKRDEENLDFCAIVTSIEMGLYCAALNIPVVLLQAERPNWSFDGADEVDSSNNLIKGRGGALLREKLLMASSPEIYIVADASKRVEHLGQNFSVPVEIHPDAILLVESSLKALKGVSTISLRQAGGKDGPVITEYGNLILDVKFNDIGLSTEKDLRSITGVVETGLFIGYPVKII